MKYLPSNTLAHFQSAPQTHLHDLSELPVSVFGASTLAYKSTCDHATPTQEAVTFYALNHAVSIIRKLFTQNEPLPEWAQTIMQTYTDVCMGQGERMLHYILLITTREMRHLKSCTSTFWSAVEHKFDKKSSLVLQHISSNGDENTAMNKFLQTPPDMTIGQYMKTLSYAFHKAGNSGWLGSYGGPPWGQVADAAVAYLTGETSMEMLVDTGYTLAHNGGPIFNKSMMYGNQDAHQLLTILDVQRAGQMLELMLQTQTMGVKKTPLAEEAAKLIKAHYPVDTQGNPTLKGYVDWKLVNDLRPDEDKQNQPHKYDSVVGKQTQPVAAKPKVAKAKPVATEPLMVGGKKVKVTGTYLVYPHQSVTTFERMEQ